MKCYIIYILLNSYATQGRVDGRDAMKTLWIAKIPADHTWRIITSGDEMKWNEMNEMVRRNGEIKFMQEKMGETPRKTYPDSVSSTTKLTWGDRDAS